MLFYHLNSKMPGKLYLNRLILFGIWSTVVIGSFADANIKESSSFLARQKRVISLVPGEDRAADIRNYPYVVYIRVENRIYCTGVILSRLIVITAAACAYFDKTRYQVVPGSTLTRHIVATHNVTNIKIRNENIEGKTSNGIALFTVKPPIVFNNFSTEIKLHAEPLLPGQIADFSGWGYDFGPGTTRGTDYSSHLRTIKVPIMAHQQCQHIYRNHFTITDKDICTFDPNRRSGNTDMGAPLVIAKSLVGIFLMRGPNTNIYQTGYPDIFAMLQHRFYRMWIIENLKHP